MLSKNIKYTDYNGVEREEKFLFNLSKAELMEMEIGTTGGLADMLTEIIASKDGAKIIKIFKELVLKAYGEKSSDGKRFIKVSDTGVPLSLAFSQTEAYSELFMELASDADAAAAFVAGIIPGDIDISDIELPDNLKTPEVIEAINKAKAADNKVAQLPSNNTNNQ